MRKLWATLAMGLVIVALLGAAALRTAPARAALAGALGARRSDIAGDSRYLGLAIGGAFYRLAPPPASLGGARLTRMQMQVAAAPDSQQLALSAYEGRAILAQGHDGGGWIYNARIIAAYPRALTPLLRWAWRE